MSHVINSLLSELEREIELQDITYKMLLQRYDDALKRMNDMQAELEYLRREVNRG